MTAALAIATRARRRLRHNRFARSLRAAALTGVDGVERLVLPADGRCPPRRLRGVGAGDFRAVGNALVEQLTLTAGLRPTDHVLDIGCGSGRLALPLTRFLRGGRYEGFDIDAEMIAWCRRAITPRHPSFGFKQLDVANTHYNPAGGMTADAVTSRIATRASTSPSRRRSSPTCCRRASPTTPPRRGACWRPAAC